jgi:hypothetical protein
VGFGGERKSANLKPRCAVVQRFLIEERGKRACRPMASGAALPVTAMCCTLVLRLAKPKTRRGGYRGVARGSCLDVMLRRAAKNNNDGVHAKTPQMTCRRDALSSVSSTSVAATDRLQKLLTERVLEEAGGVWTGPTGTTAPSPAWPRWSSPPIEASLCVCSGQRAGGTIPRTRSAALILCRRIPCPGKTALQTHFLAPQLATCNTHAGQVD